MTTTVEVTSPARRNETSCRNPGAVPLLEAESEKVSTASRPSRAQYSRNAWFCWGSEGAPAGASRKYPIAFMGYATRIRSQFGQCASVFPALALFTTLVGSEIRQPRQRLRSSFASARPWCAWRR